MQKSSDITDTLVRSVAELRALQRYTLEAIQLQQHEEDLRDHSVAARLLEDLVEVVRGQVQRLDLEVATLNGSAEALRAAASSMAGAFLGFFTKARSHETAKMLRDDYTLLNLATVGYLTLHTTAGALRHSRLADMALAHHRELEPFAQEIASMLPHLVLRDLSQQFGGLNRAAAENTVRAAGRSVFSDTELATA